MEQNYVTVTLCIVPKMLNIGWRKQPRAVAKAVDGIQVQLNFTHQIPVGGRQLLWTCSDFKMSADDSLHWSVVESSSHSRRDTAVLSRPVARGGVNWTCKLAHTSRLSNRVASGRSVWIEFATTPDCYIGWQWRNFVSHLCLLVFAAILWVKLLEMFVAVISSKYALFKLI